MNRGGNPIQPVDHLLAKASDQLRSCCVAHGHDEDYETPGSHSPQVPVPFNEDRIGSVSGRGNGRRHAGWTTSHDHDIALPAYPDLCSRLCNQSRPYFLGRAHHTLYTCPNRNHTGPHTPYWFVSYSRRKMRNAFSPKGT